MKSRAPTLGTYGWTLIKRCTNMMRGRCTTMIRWKSMWQNETQSIMMKEQVSEIW